jgi:hypothetical protein
MNKLRYVYESALTQIKFAEIRPTPAAPGIGRPSVGSGGRQWAAQ